MKKPEIRVEVVSDVVCPWCYIGKRRLEKAVEQLKDNFEVTVTFSPFELNPTMPAAGADQKQYLMNKFGGEDRYHQLTGHVTSVAAEEGLAFHYEKQKVSPNTFNAHRVIWYAGQHGRQAAVKEALMKAYFEDGVDLSSEENLVAVAASAGLDNKKVTEFLHSDNGVAEVKLAEQMNQQRGITGVPFYIINNKYGVSGAQPSATFVQALSEIGKESIASGESCDAEAKEC